MKINRSQKKRYGIWTIVALAMLLLIVAFTASTAAMPPYTKTYTLDADFDEGTLVNVNHSAPNNDQLQLDSVAMPFEFIWVAASGHGTIVKIDTVTGTILGEYQSAPDNRGRNPSRTTVDGHGNVWAGNRDEAVGGKGSVVEVGLQENGQCVDRNGNGVIDTSSGLGDVKPWPNPGGVDDNGGVSSAQDECIIKYVRVSGDNVRHVSVDANNNVWTAGNFGADNSFDLIDGVTGAILVSTGDLTCGGYGGLVDGNGVIWSSNRGPGAISLLRYDTNGTDLIADDSYTCLTSSNSYGLGIDSNGNIWNPQWTSDTVLKFNSSGVLFAGFPKPSGGQSSRGAVVTADDHVWIANSDSNDVTRLDNSGALQATIPVGLHPTGVAVDAAGKVWVTNHNSHDAMRIDPGTNLVDLTVSLGAGASPYNYSDMTGSTLIAPPNFGTWTVDYNSTIPGANWSLVSWTADEPGDSTIAVQVSSSADGITFGAPVAMANGGDPAIVGQYVRVEVSFTRATTSESPILYDLTISANQDPDCDDAEPSVFMLWPPNHKFHDIEVFGVTDPDGDPVAITIDSIFQDEHVDELGDGTFAPDGAGVGTSTAEIRAESSGLGDGRFYHISFTADDGKGGTCSSAVNVVVPHDRRRGSVLVDGGPLFDSTEIP